MQSYRGILVGALAGAVVLTTSAMSPGSSTSGSAIHEEPAGPQVATANPVPDGGAPVAAEPAEPVEVTLVTGDRVLVERSSSGLSSFTIEPAERADGAVPEFEVVEDGVDAYVLPSDAAHLVPEVLDLELFNVHALLALADTGHAEPGTPVIVRPDDDGGPGVLSAVDGMSVGTWLSSVDAAAAVVEPDGSWWRSVESAGATEPSGAPDLFEGGGSTPAAGQGLDGIERLWLDALVEVSLDESVPLVGAPDAWEAGYDGTGQTVAVLDTGIDAEHPDLAGKVVVTENFTDSDSATDRHGHGTHVAGIITGSGEAVDGRYVGVAPGVDLMNGKVLGDGGSGPTSGVIAGMEWAAANGADVINLSVGGSPTDGTDPASAAVDALTEEHDVLFVIAAGNSGPRDQTVTAPGAASAALTVGSVDKAEQLANTSSRGPRVGDHAIKPEITAPGVGIAAARAEGTALGPIVDEHYTRIGGTSMATPHVAGAAAIALQRDPGLGPGDLKAVLANTAAPNPDLDVYQQGGGRLDILGALDAPVRGDAATVDFGLFPYPHDDLDPVEAEVTYTNTTDVAVEVELSLSVDRREGGSGDDLLSVSPATLPVEAGGSATATVTLDARDGEVGLYGGYLTAELDGEPVARTALGFSLEPESYDLEIVGFDADGAPAAGSSSVDVIDANDTTAFLESSLRYVDGVARVRVPVGTYGVLGQTITTRPGGTNERTFVGVPEIEVDSDTMVVLDAEAASPITVDTVEHPDVEYTGPQVIAYHRGGAEAGSYSHSYIYSGPRRLESATPTDRVRTGEFEFYYRPQLNTVDGSARYDLVFAETGGITEDLRHVVTPETVGRVEQRFHSDVGGHTRNEVRHMFRPWSTISFGVATGLEVPAERTDFLIPGDTRYNQHVYGEPPFTGMQREPMTRYSAGEVRERAWMKPVNGPGFIDGGEHQADSPSVRDGDDLRFTIQEWLDADRNYGVRHTDIDIVESRLYADGALVGTGERSAGVFGVGADEATYRYEVDVERDALWWQTSVASNTAWTFASAGTGDDNGPVGLQLLSVAYDVDVDLSNTAPAVADRQGPPTIGLFIGHQPSVDDPAIVSARTWVSFDDGDTWSARPVRPLGDGAYEVVLPNRDPAGGSGFVSIRTEARDADGNRIEQTVHRAWRLPTS